jgi:alpha-mannosidase
MKRSSLLVAVLAATAGAMLWCDAAEAAEAAPPGDTVRLRPADAAIRGGARYYAFGDFLGSWTDAAAVIEWDLEVKEAGNASVELTWACAPGNGGDFELTIGGRRLTGKTESTGDWYAYKKTALGEVQLPKGPCKATLKAGPFKGAAMNVRAIALAPLRAEVRPAPWRGPSGVYIVPNFHPASCGWLTNWSMERNYCANTYLDHLDRVRDDPEYAFALSEVNNIIAIANFEPARFEELKARVKEGRVELVNAMFLEPTINLSGGEALVKMGVEGLRWQTQVMGVRPRFAWTIDVCGTHDQMAQITAGLGLEAMVYTRKNPTGSTIHWAESPDGSRTIALSPGHYSELGQVFGTRDRLTEKQLLDIELFFDDRAGLAPCGRSLLTPAGLPVLVLAGAGDYALAPARNQYPGEFIRQWREASPRMPVRFTTLGNYVDAALPPVKSGTVQVPTMRGGTAYDFDSFWIQSPRVKSWYRRSEHGLQAAEALAAIASLKSDFAYPVQPLYHAWLLMLLNMDRNTLWGAAGGMVFEHDKSWDVRDRFEWVEAASGRTFAAASKSLMGEGKAVAFFNPANWRRNDPIRVELPAGVGLAGATCQAAGDGRTVLCRLDLPSLGTVGVETVAQGPAAPKETALPDVIETGSYAARIDPTSGALASLRLKPSGREVLGGPANVIVAERPKTQQGDPGDFTAARPGRNRIASTGDAKARVVARDGPLAIEVEVEGTLLGQPCRRLMRFYKDHPRIDCETELNDIPDRTVVVAEFPLAAEVDEVRRGIPYGFSHGAWAKPNPDLHGWTRGITPAVRWSHYALAGGGGLAILDRGLAGRELNDKTPILYLYNATDKYYGYPNAWLSGRGNHRLQYALVVHDGGWNDARIGRLAWEFNCPPVVVPGRAAAAPQSFIETSDNLIVEALRREGEAIELRMVECLGRAGAADVTVNLPHKAAALTDLVGARGQFCRGGPVYGFPVRPQQILTMRLTTAAAVQPVRPLLEWDELVPEAKRAALHVHTKDKGHPPRGL